MKKSILFILTVFCVLTVYGQQSAKKILDNTAAAFKKAGGIETAFSVKVFSNNQLNGTSDGTIKLKGEKFLIETPEAITWFDGETQWTYRTGSEEVNITNPTDEELQEINPYALLNMYQQGYNYAAGATKSYQGKPVSEVILTAADKKKDIIRIVLYVSQAYQPLFILIDLRDGTRNEITVNSYKTGTKFTDSLFIFDEKQYPQAEIIDLRYY